MANGRIAKYIFSFYLKELMSIYSALSFSTRVRLLSRDYYNSFNRTTSEVSKGELNYFIDTFLETALVGQGATIARIEDRVEGLRRMDDRLEKDPKINSPIIFKCMKMLNIFDFFLSGVEFEREQIIEEYKDEFPMSTMRDELDELEKDDYLRRTKSRPSVYAVGQRLY